MNRIIEFALRRRLLVLVIAAFVLAAGVVSYLQLNIEAYPDPVPPLVDIVTQSSGQSAEEIERYVTIPIEIQMAGISRHHGAYDFAVRLVRRQGPVHVRLHV